VIARVLHVKRSQGHARWRGSSKVGFVFYIWFGNNSTLKPDSRKLLNASFLSLLRTYILSPPTASPPDGLVTLLQSPRIRKVDVNQLDAASGTTLLHEAAKRKDLRVVELAIGAGADVFVRDRRGRGVIDSAGRDDRVKAYLRQFTNQNTALLESQASQTEEPAMKGYLTKYGNLAKGYNTRWFVLKNGMLSCKYQISGGC
jgi:ankyrin repeat protein